MNRRGHIGTMLMVFGALILVINALLVMQSFKFDISKTRADFRLTADKLEGIHEYIIKNVKNLTEEAIFISKDSADFENSFNNSLKVLAEKERMNGLDANLYAKLALGQYSLNFDGVNYALVVDGIFEQVIVEKNEAKYNHNLKILFNKTAVISIEVL